MPLRTTADRWLERLLAPGAAAHLAAAAAERLAGMGQGAILDVGCGFDSRVAGHAPIGVDIDLGRIRALSAPGVVASATRLPFADGAFVGVVSFGLLHHLSDEDARRAIDEVIRVRRENGLALIFDGVRPDDWRRRPAAAVIRDLDRGRHMRHESALRGLFDEFHGWRFERVSYAHTGLEGVWCVSGGG
jgi:SAM-dependent methyltransferase